MYNFDLKGVRNPHEFEELVKVFLPPSEFALTSEGDLTGSFEFKGDKNGLKRDIYRALADLTGKRPKWGILTGIRPVKLTGELLRGVGSEAGVRRLLREDYLLPTEKIDLLFEIYHYQQALLEQPAEGAVGVYISIPFCPTRCLYCSFPSNQVKDSELDRYLQALRLELRFVGKKMAACGQFAESIYLGGGTPTTLNQRQLRDLMGEIQSSFDLTRTREITVEAGRPDTISEEKLEVMKDFNVTRISINPQTMQDRTLKLIGRNHCGLDIARAFDLARKSGIPVINADVIAGLPEETLEDFAETLEQVMELGTENITVHTLAVKRSSGLKDLKADIHYENASLTEEMTIHAKSALEGKGYKPYYLYKQKHTAENTENIGYCKNDTIGVYNMRIMEEKQDIIAIGAGGMTKAYYPAEDRLERVPNVSNYEVYIDRIDEMLQRKEAHLFRRYEIC